jgi:hypothetical protein
MHHSEVIKLVEKWLADPESVALEELKSAVRAAKAAAKAARAAAIAVVFDHRAAAYAAYWAAVYAAYWAARAATMAEYDDYWTAEAKEQVDEYHKLIKG